MSASQPPDPPWRDPVLDAAWKAHSTELPPRRVDAAILAAAHRESGERPRAIGDDDGVAETRAPSRAWWGFAAAATIGAIAFGVVQMAPPPASPEVPVAASDVPAVTALERRESAPVPSPTPPVASEAPATSAAPVGRSSARSEPVRVRPAQSPPAATDKLTTAPAAPAAMPLTGQVSANIATAQDSALAPAAVPTTPRAFPAEPARKQEADAGSRSSPARDREDARSLAKESAAPPSGGAAMARSNEAPARVETKRRESDTATAALAPEAWVAKIVTLLEAGRGDDAARELRAFRNAHPDADNRLPPALRDWAATVGRVP